MAGQNMTPVTGSVVTTSKLNIRSGAPSVSAAIAAKVEPGSRLPVRGIVAGDAVNGNPQWYVGLNDTYFWSGACAALVAGAVTPAVPAGAHVLSGRVESARPGAHGFDCNRPLNTADAHAFRARGFEFCVRYLTRASDQENSNDLTRGEAEIILNSGLALMAVQHVAQKGWVPNGDLGKTYGDRAVANAKQVGLPPGVNIFLDLEELRGDTPRQDVIDYCNAWFSAVDGAGYVSGIYVGVNIVISADDLFWNLKTKHYWKSGSNVPDIPQRGYQMIQHIPSNADDDQNVDTDMTRNDAFGDAVQWLTRA